MSKPSRLLFSPSMKAPVIEAYKILRTNIQFSNVDDNLKVILVTSSSQQEGKSTVSCNLAISMAQANNKVLLVDCDLRRPSIHRNFHLLNVKGLTNVLAEKIDYREISNVVGVPRLEVLTSGPKPPNPSELLGSARMEAFIQSASNQYDFIILDAPPVLPVTDAMVLSKLADGVIFVIKYGHVPRDKAKSAVESLERIGTKFLGAVINDIPEKGIGYYGNEYYEEDMTEEKDLGSKLKRVLR